jgi:hypothetical protein
MIAAHITNAIKAGWWLLALSAMASGVPSWEFLPFLGLTSAVLHAIDVSWWLQGWTLTRRDAIGTMQVRPDVEGEPVNAGIGSGGISAGTTESKEIFNWWVRRFLKEDMNGKVTGGDAYENYAANCRANWHQPESSATFGAWLTELADNSGGKIKKIKASSIYYQGWTLVGGGDHGAIDADVG